MIEQVKNRLNELEHRLQNSVSDSAIIFTNVKGDDGVYFVGIYATSCIDTLKLQSELLISDHAVLKAIDRLEAEFTAAVKKLGWTR